MALFEKKHPTPVEKTTIPKGLLSLVKAFSADEEEARALIQKAFATIHHSDNVTFKSEMSTEEFEGIVALMNGLSPKNRAEAIYCAQAVLSYINGLRLLGHSYPEDERLGLKLLKFSNKTMLQLRTK